VSCNL